MRPVLGHKPARHRGNHRSALSSLRGCSSAGPAPSFASESPSSLLWLLVVARGLAPQAPAAPRELVRRPGDRLGPRPDDARGALRRPPRRHVRRRLPRRPPSDRALERRVRARLERSRAASSRRRTWTSSAREAASSSARSRRRSTCSTRSATRTRCGARSAATAGRAGARDGAAGDPARPRPGLRPDLRRGEAIALPFALLVLVARASASRSRSRSRSSSPPARSPPRSLASGRSRTRADGHVRDEPRRADRARRSPSTTRCSSSTASARSSPAGSPSTDAVVRTMATAGRAVVASGLAVAVGPRAAALHAGAAPALDRHRRPADPARVDRGRADAPAGAAVARSGAASAVARPARRRRVWARLARDDHAPARRLPRRGTALLLALAVAGARARRDARLVLEPAAAPRVDAGLALLRDGVGAGAVTPIEVVVDSGEAGRRAAPTPRGRRPPRRRGSLHDPRGARSSRAGGEPRTSTRPAATRASSSPRATSTAPAETQRARAAAARRPCAARRASRRERASSRAARPPQGVDFLDRSYGAFPWLVLGVLALTYLVLLRAFRSLAPAAEGGAAEPAVGRRRLRAARLVFHGRRGTRVGRAQVEGWIPIFLFATLFGLSMDYEVFLVSRMREAWDATARQRARRRRGPRAHRAAS